MIMSISKSLYPFNLMDFSLYPYTFFCCSSLPQLFNDFIYYHCCSFIFFCFLCLWLCLALPLRRLPLPASVSLPASVCACVSWVGSPMCLVRADAGMRLVHAHAGLGLESFPLVFDAPFLALRFWTRGA